MERYLSITEVEALTESNRSVLDRVQTFPLPDAMIGKTRGWRRETIEAWQAQRPRAGKHRDTPDLQNNVA